MIICLCEGVSKREIEVAAQNGASSIEDISMACGAGQGCGACHDQIIEILEQQKPVASEKSCAISNLCSSNRDLLEPGVLYVGII